MQKYFAYAHERDAQLSPILQASKSKRTINLPEFPTEILQPLPQKQDDDEIEEDHEECEQVSD